jgi:hypothetical protein
MRVLAGSVATNGRDLSYMQFLGFLRVICLFALTLRPHMLELPFRWKKPQTIFVNSMSDLFHDEVRSRTFDKCST